MGVFTKKIVGISCDNCTALYREQETGYGFFIDEELLMESIGDDSGWKKIDGKWYCPDCVEKLFDYDEENDEYKLKTEE